MTTGTPKAAPRPGVVTFISLVIFVQGVLDAVAAVVTFVRMDDHRYQVETGLSSTNLLWTGIGYAVVAVILISLSVYLRQGAQGARTIITVVWVIRMIWGVFLMIWYPLLDSSFQYGLLALLVGWWVLWALHSNEKSQEFFDRA